MISPPIVIWKGDITRLDVDGIVNAANSTLLGGGGVDGCIHKAAGPKLLEECKKLNGCMPGEAKITQGFNLKAKYIIHTVGPIGENEALLKSCYRKCLSLAVENKIKTLAFCCISTGIYGYPRESAARIALSTVKDWFEINGKKLEKVIFCVYDDADFKLYKDESKLIINRNVSTTFEKAKHDDIVTSKPPNNVDQMKEEKKKIFNTSTNAQDESATSSSTDTDRRKNEKVNIDQRVNPKNDVAAATRDIITERKYVDSRIEKDKVSISTSINVNTKVDLPASKRSFTCEICGITTSRRDNLNRHMQNKHETSYKDEKSIECRTICSFPSCNLEFYHKSKYIEHLEKEHDVSSKLITQNFASENEFITWKEKEEAENFVYFSKQKGDTKSSKYQTSYYICQLDGHNTPHRKKGEAERKTKKRYKYGQVKTGLFCPARMSAKTDLKDKSIVVTYIRAHNHSINISNTVHHPLPKTLINDIKTKLSIGVPINNIYRDLRDGQSDRNCRDNADLAISKKHLLKKSNISDINRHMNYGKRLHTDDSTSTYLLVKKLEKEDYNIVLVYKPQGSPVLIGPKTYNDIDVKNDLFAIGIQTKKQLEMFIKHASKVVCIDGTHGTNHYAYTLVTLVVPDEFNKGYPVGFFISNRVDELCLKPFFEEIKARCPDDFKINCVMTDDDNSGWNAFSAVFGGTTKHLLCKWHICRTWRRSLSKYVKSPDVNLNEEIYQSLIVLIDERNQQEFEMMLQGFLELCKEKAPSFGEYFETYYCPRVENWAMCYRNFEHANTDTNMFVEAFHNKLKTCYMDRKPNKRVDDLINLLLAIEEDDFWRNKREIIYSNHASKVSDSRHERGICISNEDVVMINETTWSVKSQTHTSRSYTIKQLNADCENEKCSNRCEEFECMQLCNHLFTCDCKDPAKLCKHIHKIQSQKKFPLHRNAEVVEDDILPPVFSCTTTSPNKKTSKASKNNQYKRFNENVNQLTKLMEINIVQTLQLPSVNSILENIIRQCEAVTDLQLNSIPQEPMPSNPIPPNKKLDLQWRPKQMTRTKKCVKRKVVPIKAPDFEGRKIIKDELISSPSIHIPTNNIGPPLKKTKTEAPNQNETSKDTVKAKSFPPSNEVTSKPEQHEMVCKTTTQNIIPVKTLLGVPSTEPVLKNGCHSIYPLDMFSIDDKLSITEVAQCKRGWSRFKLGWLHDEIVNSFFFRLSKKYHHILYCGSAEASNIAANKSFRGMWREENLSKKKVVLVPFNPTNAHWVLIYINIKDKSIFLLNPMSTDLETDKSNISLALTIGRRILEIKFNIIAENNVRILDHILQQDSKSCGVFVCYYAEQILKGKSLNLSFGVYGFRRRIYNAVAGKCLQNVENISKDACKICQISAKEIKKLERSEWVQCNRCSQWFHCKCVNISHQEANGLEEFLCA